MQVEIWQNGLGIMGAMAETPNLSQQNIVSELTPKPPPGTEEAAVAEIQFQQNVFPDLKLSAPLDRATPSCADLALPIVFREWRSAFEAFFSVCLFLLASFLAFRANSTSALDSESFCSLLGDSSSCPR